MQAKETDLASSVSGINILELYQLDFCAAVPGMLDHVMAGMVLTNSNSASSYTLPAGGAAAQQELDHEIHTEEWSSRNVLQLLKYGLNTSTVGALGMRNGV